MNNPKPRVIIVCQDRHIINGLYANGYGHTTHFTITHMLHVASDPDISLQARVSSHDGCYVCTQEAQETLLDIIKSNPCDIVVFADIEPFPSCSLSFQEFDIQTFVCDVTFNDSILPFAETGFQSILQSHESKNRLTVTISNQSGCQKQLLGTFPMCHPNQSDSALSYLARIGEINLGPLISQVLRNYT